MNLISLFLMIFYVGIYYMNGLEAYKSRKAFIQKVERKDKGETKWLLAKREKEAENKLEKDGNNETSKRQADVNDIIEVDLKSEKKAGGKLGTSSNYDDDYGAIQAFDGLGTGSSYWSSAEKPDSPVWIWFQFQKPQHIVKFSFQKPSSSRAPLTSGDYEIFASEAANCGDVEPRVQLVKKKTSKEAIGANEEEASLLKNFFKYRCYGFKIQMQNSTPYASMKDIQFWKSKDQIQKIEMVLDVTGTAGTTSEYDDTSYKASKAFFGESYWSSVHNPSTPVLLWFEFKKPQRIVSIAYEKVGDGRSPQRPDGYELFGSNGYPCYDLSQHVKLAKTAESEDAVSGKNKIDVANNRKYTCYGFKILTIAQSSKPYAALKKVEFWKKQQQGIPPRTEVEVDLSQELFSGTFKPIPFVGGTAGGSSQFDHANGYRCAFQAQGQPGQCTIPWTNAQTDSGKKFPQMVFYQFPELVYPSKLAFSSRTESRLWRSPTKFDIIASNDVTCTAKSNWVVVKNVQDVSWSKLNQEKSWDLNLDDDVGYRCWGIKVLAIKSSTACAIQNTKMWTKWSGSGEAGASSSFPGYDTTRAFAADSAVYWSSMKNPVLPVHFWVRFGEPKHIMHISFQSVGQGALARSPQGPEDYELFASNSVECGQDWKYKLGVVSMQKDGEDNHVFLNNMYSFRCYGFKILKLYHGKPFAALKKVRFWEM